MSADRRLVAIMLSNRAARLLRLVELKAPEVVIEQERRLVGKALAEFPIDAEAARRSDEIDQQNADEVAAEEAGKGKRDASL